MDKENIIISLQGVTKVFDGTTVVDNFNLDITKGEFVTFLGPSGCGKTTTLRMIAGFEMATSGEILLNGVDISNIPPHKRPINTVFQRYALFPHLDVYDNVAFGLKIKKIPSETKKNKDGTPKMRHLTKDEIDEKVRHALKIVDLEEFEWRDITTLSGGQQQRVAIARAIVNEPEILLLDEPLGALDLKMRKDMQLELKDMHKKLGITFIYVTHNQEEALSMSDRIVIINKGNIEQIGTPQEIYKNPKKVFVADFIGDANILDATVIKSNSDGIRVSLLEGYEQDINTSEEFEKGEKIKIVIRPEDVKVFKRKINDCIEGIIIDTTYNGDSTSLLLDIPGKKDIKVSIIDEEKYEYNSEVYIAFDPKHIIPLRK